MQRIEETVPSPHAASARRGPTQDPTLDVHSSEFEVVDFMAPVTASWLGRGPFFLASVSFMVGTAVLLAMDAVHTRASLHVLDWANSKVNAGASVIRRTAVLKPVAAPTPPAARLVPPAVAPSPSAERETQASDPSRSSAADGKPSDLAESSASEPKGTAQARHPARSRRERTRGTPSGDAQFATKRRHHGDGSVARRTR